MTKTEINYKNGKIYKIEPIVDHDEEDIYIGSTTKQYLSQRMTKHRRHYIEYKEGKKCSNISSFILFDKYGYENCKIILLELVEANTKDELRIKETEYIKNNKCINKIKRPFRTNEEKTEYRKQYYENNKEKQINQVQEYRLNNKEKINEYQKEYRLNNKEKQKQYYEKNKDKILKRRKELKELKKNILV